MRIHRKLWAERSREGAGRVVSGIILLCIMLCLAWKAEAHLKLDLSVARWVPYAIAEVGGGFAAWLFFCGVFRFAYSLRDAPFPQALYWTFGMMCALMSAHGSVVPLLAVLGRGDLFPVVFAIYCVLLVGIGVATLVILRRHPAADRGLSKRNRETRK